MFIYSKCLHPDDYLLFDEHNKINDIINRSNNFRYEHEHRKWEYGLAIKFLNQCGVSTVLNVGGGNSPLSTILVDCGMSVTEIDPNNPVIFHDNITYIKQEFPTKNLPIYDAVVSTSVIEHVQNDENFFIELLRHSRNVVFITTDFSVSGEPCSTNHIRTYNSKGMENFIEISRDYGFEAFAGYDYKYRGNFIYDYTFASLALRKINV